MKKAFFITPTPPPSLGLFKHAKFTEKSSGMNKRSKSQQRWDSTALQGN
jgi:hypothetical protein